MLDYEIRKMYEDMEIRLIKSMKRNLQLHLDEEDATGFKYPQWQAMKLKGLKRYQRQNKDIVGHDTKGFSSSISKYLKKELKEGSYDALKQQKEAMGDKYKANKRLSNSFFKINDKKVNTLINSVNNDLKTANRAVLRMTNDQYRKVIFQSQFYVANGVMTPKQAIDAANKDFLRRGLNVIEYKDGKRVNIASYSQMAIRTAGQRAMLMGEGAVRKKMKQHLIKISAHGTSCPLCQEWQGKVLIDDVYGGGSSKDGKYPLLSDAMDQGLFHPNCKHGIMTYYSGADDISDIKASYANGKDGHESDAAYQDDMNYINRKIKEYRRLEVGSLDKTNIKTYKAKKNEWENKLVKLEKKNLPKPIPMSEYDYKSLAYKLRDEGYLTDEILNTRRWGYDGEDLATKKLLYDNHYNDLPKVVDKEVFDNLGDDYIKVYRGVKDTDNITAKEINEQFRSGELYIGKGLFGNGTYTAVNKEVAEHFGTDILEIAIPKNARIINYKDIKEETIYSVDKDKNGWKPINSRIYDFTNEGVDFSYGSYDYSKAKFTSKEVNGLRTLLNDDTFKAVSCNYDIIEVEPKEWYRVLTEEARQELDKTGIEKKPYYVILNRGSVIVKR